MNERDPERDARGTDSGGQHADGYRPDENSDDGHYVYVLECADGTLYTGYTTDVERRVAAHNAGEGAKYTRGRTPVEVVHVESFASQSAAMSREYDIKGLSRAEKERLIGFDQ